MNVLPFNRPRPGFTLVELLVVIAIIGTLVALLLPAVQSAREAGRRNTCLNNMRQLQLALQQYDTSFNKLPGYVNSLDDVTSGKDSSGNYNRSRRASWVVMVFPYMEAPSLWDYWSADFSSPTFADVPAQYTPELEGLVCPSDPPEGTGQPWLSYVGNAGQSIQTSSTSSPFQAVTWDESRTSGASKPIKMNIANRENVANGVFFDLNKSPYAGPADGREVNPRVQCSMNYVQSNDGTSKTLMLSENTSAIYWSYLPYDNNNGVFDSKQHFGFVWHNELSSADPIRRINGVLTADTPPPIDTDGLQEHFAYPSSAHPGGVNAAFVDGHSVFLQENIDPRVYAQLMTSNRNRAWYYDANVGSSAADVNATDRKLPQPSDNEY